MSLATIRLKMFLVNQPGRLLVGRGGEEFTAAEVPDQEKPPILRAYLRKWKWEVGAFFEGTDADSSEDELRRIAPKHPIFKIQART